MQGVTIKTTLRCTWMACLYLYSAALPRDLFLSDRFIDFFFRVGAFGIPLRLVHTKRVRHFLYAPLLHLSVLSTFIVHLLWKQQHMNSTLKGQSTGCKRNCSCEWVTLSYCFNRRGNNSISSFPAYSFSFPPFIDNSSMLSVLTFHLLLCVLPRHFTDIIVSWVMQNRKVIREHPVSTYARMGERGSPN